MHYGSLLKKATERTVRAAIIGAGDYGRSLIFQAPRGPGLSIVAVCDADPERALAALAAAGFSREDMAVCDDTQQAKAAVERGKVAVVTDGVIVAQLPVDVVVEATGNAEAAALHASRAISEGRHVVMVTKEADSVIGPLLARRAAAAGVVYTPVDGDQPSLLIQLTLWARIVGLDILCAAKASEYDFVYDPGNETVTCLTRTIPAPGLERVWSLDGRAPAEVVKARSEACAAIPQHTVADLTEMGIVANALDLGVDRPEFHAPIARTQEIPDILAPQECGGILSSSGVVDVVNLLRRPDEFSLAGGVFVVVRCEDEATWEMLRSKGHLVSRNGKAATIANPVHLLGVQSATTILLAALEQRSSGTGRLEAKFDLVGRASQPLKAGTHLQPKGAHHEIDGVDGLLVPAVRLGPDAPIPFHMMSGHVLATDIAPGQLITMNDIVPPQESELWSLRREMDAA